MYFAFQASGHKINSIPYVYRDIIQIPNSKQFCQTMCANYRQYVGTCRVLNVGACLQTLVIHAVSSLTHASYHVKIMTQEWTVDL